MKTKYKILTINLLVVFITILTVITGIFTVLMKAFSLKDLKNATISVAADSKMTFKKEGLLDLIGSDVDLTVQNPISISSKEQAVELLNGYLNDNFYSGKVRAVSSTFVVGGGSLGGVGEIYYGFLKSESYFEDDTFNSCAYYCKVPNADGDDDGAHAQANYIERTTYKDGIYSYKKVSGEKDVCYYTFENGSYKTHMVDGVFENHQVDEWTSAGDPGYELFPFLINNETVTGIEIDNSSSFVVKVKYNFAASALSKYRQSIYSDTSDSTGLPTFHSFNFEVTFNKFSGEVIEIAKYENYTLPCILGVDVNLSRSQTVIFKKEN